MSAIRRGAILATDLACESIGRYQVVRASRFILNRARRDVPSNNVDSGGELCLQRWVIEALQPDERIQVVDVGANVGQWSRGMLLAAERADRRNDLDLHAFEPSAYTFEILSKELAGQNVALNQLAVSDNPGQSLLYVVHPAAGINSLHKSHDAPEGTITESVNITTLDDYSTAVGLQDIALVKIDTEGNDMAVLRGCLKLLSDQRISVVQFEYNRWWVYARAYLRDAFDLIQPLGYTIGKLTPWGIEFYPGWDYELETFIQGNYVAVAPRALKWVPTVKWWKSR